MKMAVLISPVCVLTVAFCIVLQPLIVSADIMLSTNDSNTQMLSYPATFGAELPKDGLKGLIVVVEPIDACSPVLPKPSSNQTTLPYIALIRRYDCDFDVKVLNAQQKGYLAAIVFNVGSNTVLPMSPGEHGSEVVISSVFVGEDDGQILMKNDYTTGSTVTMYPYVSFPSPLYYFVPFLAVCGTCLLFLVVYIVAKYVRDRRRLRRSRLSREHLKKLPIRKFKKGDLYDVCAICLEEYEEDDKLRILPCNHAFHCPCIDPWLTNNKRTCPVCKRKVIPGDVEDDSSDSDDSDSSNENTPLLFGNRGSSYGRSLGETDPLEGTSSQYSAAEDEEGATGTSHIDSTLTVSVEVESDEDSTNSYEMEKKLEQTADKVDNEGTQNT